MEYSNEISVLQGRMRCSRYSSNNFGGRITHSEHRGDGILPTPFYNSEGNSMMHRHENHRLRYTPYDKGLIRRRRRGYDINNIHIKLERDPQSPRREIQEDMQNGIMENWFKVTIPFGRKYDKAWLINSIKTHCSVSFSPVDFHCIGSRALFFVQHEIIASAIKDVSKKISDEDSHRIPIFVNPSAAPYSVKNKFTPEEMKHLQFALTKRYDVSKQALNLEKLRFDPVLMEDHVEVILNRRSCMFATLQVIESNFPELHSLNLRNNRIHKLDGLSDIVDKAPQIKILNLSKNAVKSLWELDKLKGLKLEELWLSENPVCSRFLDKSSYVSAILDYFPKLLRLDGQELSSTNITDIEPPKSVECCKERHEGCESLRRLILQFLQEYYLIYDYGDRQGLLSVYHEEACFSLTIPLKPEDRDMSNLREYFKYSRNVKNIRESYIRRMLLKYRKRDIVDSLSLLPRTEHDHGTFMVDVWLQTERMICFSVHGVFKEIRGMSHGIFRAFTRTFIAVPGKSTCLCIVNDHLLVRNISPEVRQHALSMTMARSCCSSMSTLSPDHQAMVQAFSMQSNMKLEWCQKCLEDNQWNYNKAAEIFILLQTQQKIPAEAFE